MRLAWLTDLHLNFLNNSQLGKFAGLVHKTNPDALLIGGDIAEAHNLLDYLKLLERLFPIPIYFVLGNHDYYRGSIKDVRESVTEFAKESEFCHYLPASGVVELSDNTALIGHGGWGDGGYGDYFRSRDILNDYKLIEELTNIERTERAYRIKQLGQEAAELIAKNLIIALQRYETTYLLTHVPPFAEACWHRGRRSTDFWLPHFSCKAVGDVLLDLMKEYTGRQLIVLCGHTHSKGEVEILANLRTYTGHAEYGEPEVQRVFEV